VVVVVLKAAYTLLVEGVGLCGLAAEDFVQDQVDRVALANVSLVTRCDFVLHARFGGCENGVFSVLGDVGQAMGGAQG